MNRSFAAASGIALFLGCAAAHAASRIVPAQPYAFDPVNLRMTVDSCVFAQDRVAVRAAQNTIDVNTQANNCLLPGEQIVVDIRLGSLPPGTWTVRLNEANGDIVRPAVETHTFEVLNRPEIAVFPPPPKPLTDYSGHWYKPAESGWGLSFHQSPTNVAFAAWFVYDAAGDPAWYTIQDGQWTSPARWTGAVYRTSGPPFFAPAFDPTQVTRTPAGQAEFDFTQRPGEEGFATFTYAVGGQAGSKRITRLAF
jgi:hypothetical protein